MHWQGWKGTDIALGASPPPSTLPAPKYNHPRPPPWPSTSSILTPISSLFHYQLNLWYYYSCRVCPNRWFQIPLAIGKVCNVLKESFQIHDVPAPRSSLFANKVKFHMVHHTLAICNFLSKCWLGNRVFDFLLRIIEYLKIKVGHVQPIWFCNCKVWIHAWAHKCIFGLFSLVEN